MAPAGTEAYTELGAMVPCLPQLSYTLIKAFPGLRNPRGCTAVQQLMRWLVDQQMHAHGRTALNAKLLQGLLGRAKAQLGARLHVLHHGQEVNPVLIQLLGLQGIPHACSMQSRGQAATTHENPPEKQPMVLGTVYMGSSLQSCAAAHDLSVVHSHARPPSQVAQA